LLQLVEEHGKESWALLAFFMPNRNRLQIAERWKMQLDPSINRGPWTLEEVNKAIIRLVYAMHSTNS